MLYPKLALTLNYVAKKMFRKSGTDHIPFEKQEKKKLFRFFFCFYVLHKKKNNNSQKYSTKLLISSIAAINLKLP